MILVERDETTGLGSASDGVLEARRYPLQNWRADLVALIDTLGKRLVSVRYTPYGSARWHHPGDFDGNGLVDADDIFAHLNAWFAAPGGLGMPGSGYTTANLNDDNITDTEDQFGFLGIWFEGQTAAAGVTPGGISAGRNSAGTLVGPDNSVGFCGYLHNPETSDYTVRFRHYSPQYGRWIQRDPAGYVDGKNLSLYASCSPVLYTDPIGLCIGCEGTSQVSIGLGGQHTVDLPKPLIPITFSGCSSQESTALNLLIGNLTYYFAKASDEISTLDLDNQETIQGIASSCKFCPGLTDKEVDAWKRVMKEMKSFVEKMSTCLANKSKSLTVKCSAVAAKATGVEAEATAPPFGGFNTITFYPIFWQQLFYGERRETVLNELSHFCYSAEDSNPGGTSSLKEFFMNSDDVQDFGLKGDDLLTEQTKPGGTLCKLAAKVRDGNLK